MAERCLVCGRGVMVAVACPMQKGTIHLDHCLDCEYFEQLLWSCCYRQLAEEKAEQEKAAEERAAAVSSGRQMFTDYLRRLETEVEADRLKRSMEKHRRYA